MADLDEHTTPDTPNKQPLGPKVERHLIAVTVRLVAALAVITGTTLTILEKLGVI